MKFSNPLIVISNIEETAIRMDVPIDYVKSCLS